MKQKDIAELLDEPACAHNKKSKSGCAFDGAQIALLPIADVAHNQLRGLVADYGLVAPQQLARLRAAVPVWLEDAENGLTSRFRELVNGLWDDLKTLDRRVAELDREIDEIAQSDTVAKRLQQLRGVGPMVATALVATVGNAEQFAIVRQMGASLGLTTKQHSSGGKDRLPGISKRGEAHLRSILIHGARSVIRTAKLKDGECRMGLIPERWQGAGPSVTPG